MRRPHRPSVTWADAWQAADRLEDFFQSVTPADTPVVDGFNGIMTVRRALVALKAQRRPPAAPEA